MTDGQWLFITFALLTLLESLKLRPASSRTVSFDRANSAQLRCPLTQLNLGTQNPLLLPVLPPLPVAVECSPWQLIPTDAGLEVLTPEGGQAQACIPWPELAEWAQLPHTPGTHTLQLPGGVEVRFSHPESAAAWHQRLTTWAASSPEKCRVSWLKWAHRSLDATAWEKRLPAHQKQTRWMRWLSFAVFFLCFGAITALNRWLGEGLPLLSAVAALFLAQITQAVLFWRQARAQKGRLPAVKHRFWRALGIAFLPQLSIRAADALDWRFSASLAGKGLHPLSAWPALPEKRRLMMLRRFWQYAQSADLQSAGLQQQIWRAFAKQHGLSETDLEEPAPPQEAGALSYCPQCRTQFLTATSSCRDCAGVALKPFLKADIPG
jgi:hypothetical protein